MTSSYRDSIPAGPMWKEFWPKFEKQCQIRLSAGFKAYTDKSFGRPASSLLAEAEEEIYDQILWSFISLTRVNALRKRIQRLEANIGDVELEQKLTGEEMVPADLTDLDFLRDQDEMERLEGE